MKQRVTNEEQIEQALTDWNAVKNFQGSVAFRLLVEPIQMEIEELARSYEARTLQEMATVKGQYKGLRAILDYMEKYERLGKAALEAKQIAELRKLKEQKQFDSRDL